MAHQSDEPMDERQVDQHASLQDRVLELTGAVLANLRHWTRDPVAGRV